MAVNNNAGALLLVLASLGPNARVAVSRGELIEIGGSFRLPELMASSGAELVEVGTTNRTRITDFETVAGEVDAILKVHPSNYRIDGFQEEASADDLVELAHRSGVPFINDVGSGLLDFFSGLGMVRWPGLRRLFLVLSMLGNVGSLVALSAAMVALGGRF